MTVIKTGSKTIKTDPAAVSGKSVTVVSAELPVQGKEKFLVVLQNEDEFVECDVSMRTFCTLEKAQEYVSEEEEPEGTTKVFIVKVVEEYKTGPFVKSKVY